MDEPRANTDSQDSPRPGLGGSYHLPPYSILYACPWGQHPNVILSQDSQMGVPKFPKLGPPWLWRCITLCANLQLKWGLKQTCSPCWKLFTGMWHITFMQGNQGNFWLLVVGSQIGNLTPDLSFGHNLCFKYSNGSCKTILNIYVPRSFQWYKELFNPMNFYLCNCPLKIQESIGTPTPKVGIHLRLWGFFPSHSLALPGVWNVTPGFTFGP
jgi:hypothetical protein